MLRPFLLVGVGGSGGKTLRVVRDDLLRRLAQAGWTGGLPKAWQFVHIDVPTVADGNDPDLPGQLPEREYQGLVGAGIDYRTLDASLIANPGPHAKDALGGWRPNPNKVNIPPSKGAGQFRALGRVIVLAGLNRVHEALLAARRQMTGAEVVGELQRVTAALGGKPGVNVAEPTVIVISSLAGGSGSGAVIDVCDAVRALGDKWAEESVGLLYAPDVFDDLPEEARRGVRPNSLAALAELMNGYWNNRGASDSTTEVFARYGVQIAASNRMGPRYPFLVGARNEHVTYQTQNDVYRAIGRSIATWVVSEKLQDSLTAYIQAQWAATALAVTDTLPLHPHDTETPFVALGSSRVGLGRDRFRDYGGQHLARTVVERFLRRHEELRQRGDDRTEKLLILDAAEQSFGWFLEESGLDERGEDHNQIIDALRSDTIKQDVRATSEEILKAVRETIPPKGRRADDVRREIRNAVNARRSHFQTAQLAARTDKAREWIDTIQRRLATLTARSIAIHGAPVTAEMLRRLATEVNAVRDEVQGEATQLRRWAVDVEQPISQVLNDPEAATILATTAKLEEAVKRAVQTLGWEQEAEVRETAVSLMPDLVAGVLDPLTSAVTDSVEALGEETLTRGEASGSLVARWPEGDLVPTALQAAPNEFLLEKVDEYPSILRDLVKRTVGVAEAADARREVDRQVLLGSTADDAHDQKLVVREQRWVPRDRLLQSSAAPSRARFVVRTRADEILGRADRWIDRSGTAIGTYVHEGLRDYLDPEKVSPSEHAQRLQRFEGQLIAALNAGAPLVDVNTSVLVQVHGPAEISYSTAFSEVPLPEKSPARDTFRRVLEARGKWSEKVAKAFSDGNGGFIDIFTVLAEPYEPVVFDSLMRPVMSEWGKRNKADDTRAEFWRWRRARPLDEALPLAPSTLSAMVRGWFVAGALGQIDLTGDPVKLFVPSEVGRGGEFVGFPSPTLVQVRNDSPDVLPALLESISLAMLQVNSTESIVPMRPYRRLLALGSGGDGQVPDELAAWVLKGVKLHETAVAAEDWEIRQSAVSQRFGDLAAGYERHFEKVDASTELLGHSGAYELRRHILAALGDLQRAVAGMQAPNQGGGWV